MDPKLEAGWKSVLSNEFEKDYFVQLQCFLDQENDTHTIYPPSDRIFAAFERTSFHNIKVVIIGQDPYHGPNQANGLCFSVSEGIKHPPSLANIFKELHTDIGLPIPKSGNLEKWADQEVLLLNASLTVRAAQAGSHQKKGWEQFTDTIISRISEENKDVIFLLWGSFAQAKAKLIDQKKHHILQAPHPSPLSAYRGFLGCKHFSKTNEILKSLGKQEIDWKTE
ncbi:MAG: uracil-DNA glycosylase [Bacteroidales bacterium]|nr:uracil-DNA glycosylase [Bacteroidales bacterium]